MQYIRKADPYETRQNNQYRTVHSDIVIHSTCLTLTKQTKCFLRLQYKRRCLLAVLTRISIEIAYTYTVKYLI